MRKNHTGLSDSARKHHALINNLVKEGDDYHRRCLDKKAEEVGQYSSAQLMQKFGIAQGSYLTQAETKERLDGVLNGLDYVGLSLQRLYQDHCSLFDAVAIYLNQNPQDLQEAIATKLEHNREKYVAIVEALLLPSQTYEDYSDQVRFAEWTEGLDIGVLMNLLDRPIIVIKSQGAINHAETVDCFSGDPIFVFYSGHGHYDALLQHSDLSARESLLRLHWNHTAYSFL